MSHSWLDSPIGLRPYHGWGFETTLRSFTFGRSTLYEWSFRHRDHYLTTHNTHNRQKSMPPTGFEPAIPTREPPQTHALDRADTGLGYNVSLPDIYVMCSYWWYLAAKESVGGRKLESWVATLARKFMSGSYEQKRSQKSRPFPPRRWRPQHGNWILSVNE